MKKGRPLIIKLKVRKQAAWDAFSKFIRTKYLKNGFLVCYTCGKKMTLEDAQAGHGIGGRNNAVLFMEEVVRPQCQKCNGFLNGNYPVFTMKLMEELGVKRYQNLVILSNQIVKWTASEFLEIENYYRGKLEKLRN